MPVTAHENMLMFTLLSGIEVTPQYLLWDLAMDFKIDQYHSTKWEFS